MVRDEGTEFITLWDVILLFSFISQLAMSSSHGDDERRILIIGGREVFDTRVLILRTSDQAMAIAVCKRAVKSV